MILHEQENKNQALVEDKQTEATAFSASERCTLICEDVLTHKQRWGFPEPQR